MRSHSPSEGSEGTGDDARHPHPAARAHPNRKLTPPSSKPLKKKRSFKKPRFRDRDDTPLIGAAAYIESDPDSANASFNRAFEEDHSAENQARLVDGEDVIDSNLFRNFLSNFRSEKVTSSLGAASQGVGTDLEKQRRKEEKRRVKEEVRMC